MRMMLKVSIPAEGGNAALREGSLPKIIQSLLESVKPEAAYFGPEDGKRTAFLFFDLKNASDIPAIVEPLFAGMNADVSLTPVMTPDDLRAGLQKLQGGK